MAASSAKYLLRGALIGSISTVAATSIWSRLHREKPIHIEYQEDEKQHQDNLKRASNILRFGAPDTGTQLRFYRNHVLVYDQEKKIPIWVAEHLTRENLKGKANRKHSYFKPDPDVHDRFQADNPDYLESGWSRGHMAPAGDNKKDQDAMDDTFLLSNILPQDFDNNSGFWNRLEIFCRDLTKTYKNVYVVSGPLFLSHQENGKRYVKYQVIGENEVAVPTHLYKVLISEDQNDNLQLSAFIVPNRPIDSSHKLTEFQVPLRRLEKKSGLKFIRDLNRRYDDLCSIQGCQMVEQRVLDLDFLGRDIAYARNAEAFRRAWDRAVRKGLDREPSLVDAYNKKRIEFKGEL